MGTLSILAAKYRTYLSLLELTAAIVVGFVARMASAYIPNVCFWGLALAGVVNLLPGLSITVSITELSAK